MLKKSLCLFSALALSLSLAVPVFAETSDATQTSPVNLTAAPAVFSIKVPTALPVSVDGAGIVTIPSETPKIENNSQAPVKVSGVQVTAKDDWALVDMSKDMQTVKAGTKEMALSLFGKDVPSATGIADISALTNINGGTSIEMPYNAKVAAQITQMTDANPIDVVLTFAWAE